MGDSDNSDSSDNCSLYTSSSASETDDIEKDPSFKSRIKNITPSILRRSKRLIKG